MYLKQKTPHIPIEVKVVSSYGLCALVLAIEKYSFYLIGDWRIRSKSRIECDSQQPKGDNKQAK